jgi:hypothetical protein
MPPKNRGRESGGRAIAEGGGKIRIGANCIILEKAVVP